MNISWSTYIHRSPCPAVVSCACLSVARPIEKSLFTQVHSFIHRIIIVTWQRHPAPCNEYTCASKEYRSWGLESRGKWERMREKYFQAKQKREIKVAWIRHRSVSCVSFKEKVDFFPLREDYELSKKKKFVRELKKTVCWLHNVFMDSDISFHHTQRYESWRHCPGSDFQVENPS